MHWDSIITFNAFRIFYLSWKLLDGYAFPVYTTKFCQRNQKNGMSDHQYSTVPNVMHFCVSQMKIKRNFERFVNQSLKLESNKL